MSSAPSNHRVALFLILAVLGGTRPLPAGAAAPDAGREPTHLAREFPSEGIHDVRLEASFAQIDVEQGDGDAITIEVSARCTSRWGSCEDKLRNLHLRDERDGDRLELHLEGQAHHSSNGLHVEVHLRVPAGMKLAVELGAGEVHISDAASDVRVHLGAGEIKLHMTESDVHSVDARAGVGEARMRGPQGREIAERRHLVGGTVHWDEGRGQARVDLQVGAGEVDVRLD